MKSNTELRYEFGDAGSGQIYVEGAVEENTQEFFLDTGSSQTFVHATDGISPTKIVKSGAYYGASGQAKGFDYVQIKQMALGPWIKKDFQVGLIRDVASEPPKLGLNFFKDCRVVFDLVNGQIREISDDLVNTPFVIGPKGHVQLMIEVSGIQVNCIFDTGAGLSVIDDDFVKKYPEHFQLMDSDGTVGDGNAVKIQATLYNVSQMHIGTVDLSNSTIVGINLGAAKAALGVEHLVILGFNHMVNRKWAFDFNSLRFSVS